MTSNTADYNSGDTLVLTGPDGTIYAIPRDVLLQHRATPEQVAAIEAQMDEDVSGFMMQSEYMMEKTMNYRQADLLREAEEARLGWNEAGERQAGGEAQRGLRDMRNFVVGVWRNLTPAKSPTSNA